MTEKQTKNILLGITGGIAAYKSAELVRLLIKQGYTVRVCMTQAATQFITPLTLQALSGNPVHTHLLDTEAEAAMGHIELAKWADKIIIAPCSADFMAKLAHGFADDLLSTLCLATASPIYIAPAMNQQMWANAATQDNLQTLLERNYTILGPDAGSQACGDVGMGRMLAPETILQNLFPQASLLAGKKILITAGPTREPIDPVRYITNRSSGKMGYALAEAAANMGAAVELVSGIVSLPAPQTVKRTLVETAQEMFTVTQNKAADADIFIATAAVADYSPHDVAQQKIKKSTDQLTLELTKNPDILATISLQFPHLFTVGFAAETENLEEHARVKLDKKQLDMIAANYVGKQQGFDQAENALELFWEGGQHSLPLMHKKDLAKALLAVIESQLNKK
jgi:phosphopantothenoylcysteine decarboxylase/phosphopantothenate--cysteine ligase